MHTIKYIVLLALIIPILILPPANVSLPKCTAAQHDSYKALGPDGVYYPTWHPQIDPYFGCFYDHEHGSNPAFYDPRVTPLFGYSAAQMGMSEGHAGFKVYVFTFAGRKWLLTQHQGTANAALAACTRFHTLDIVSAGIDIHGMSDFGGAVENTTDTPICGEVDSTGVRKLPVAPEMVKYEPWRTDVVTGTLDTRMTFNTKNPQTACADITCTTTLPIPDVGGPTRGTYRTLTIEWLIIGGVNYGSAVCVPYGMDYFYDCSDAPADEEFYRRNPFVTGAN